MSLLVGVVVPCRDEARVIERKLANLARLEWPARAGAPLAGRGVARSAARAAVRSAEPDVARRSEREPDAREPAGPRRVHRLIVVDDGSTDATAATAAAALARLFPPDGAVRAELVANERAPGKCGAVASALAALAGTVDLVVLSDADVVCEPAALASLARAFERDARLALACGAQRFVRDLSADGRALGADGAAPRPADDVWDRWTARARALESRAGRLFSVHGQLLAWRAELGLAPRAGLAADDLDLMLQARAGGGRVARVAAARFLEVKTPRGPHARAQGLRRARAYFEALRDRRRPLGAGWLARAQWAAYAHVPRAAPELALALAAGLLCGACALGPRALAAALGLLALALASPAGRRVLELLAWIHGARRAARGRAASAIQGGSDRWEMQRT